MPTKQRRYSVKAKEAKQILNEVSERLKVNVEARFGSKAKVEVVEADISKIYLVNGKPLFFKVGEKLLPTYKLIYVDQLHLCTCSFERKGSLHVAVCPWGSQYQCLYLNHYAKSYQQRGLCQASFSSVIGAESTLSPLRPYTSNFPFLVT